MRAKLTEQAEVRAHEVDVRAPDSFKVSLGRLFQLRKSDNGSGPAMIVVQLIAERNGERCEAFGQRQLATMTGPLFPSFRVWDAAEDMLESLVGVWFSPSTAEDAQNCCVKLFESARPYSLDFTAEDFSAFDVVTGAFQDAFYQLSGCNAALGGAPQSPQWAPVATTTDDFYKKSLSRVSRYAVAPTPPKPENNGVPANVYADAPFIAPLPKDGTKGFLLEREALRYGLASARFPNGAFVVDDPEGTRLAFKWGRSPLASAVALSICSYKEATRQLLERVEIPMPRGRVFTVQNRERAVEYADEIGYPVVCKPVAGLRGIGVVSGIKDKEHLLEALELLAQSQMGTDDFVIEEHCPGEDYRIVIVGDEVVAAVVRAPASVVGDGVHTVADLIEYKNRARKENPHLATRLIKLGPGVEYQLSLAGMDYSSVPAPGERIVLANSANLSQGGDSFEIAHKLHPSIKDLAMKAVQAVPGLGFCGLDMLIEDPELPVSEQRVTIIELNAHAAIGSAEYPMWGPPAPVARKFFEETAARFDIPLPAEQQDVLFVELTVRGKVQHVGYRRWLQKHAAAFGVSCQAENVGEREVRAELSGPADGVAAIAYLAMDGPEKAVPTSVRTVPKGWSAQTR